MKRQCRFGRWTVLKHEHFEELCAAASIGQVNGTELAELREHLGWCSPCQERYSEFLNLNAAQYAKNAGGEELTREEAVGAIDSTLFRERFLKKAAAEGIVFSVSPTEDSLPDPRIRSSSFWNWPILTRAATAFALLTVVAGGGYYVGTQRVRLSNVTGGSPVSSVDSVSEQRIATIASLEAENQRLAAEIASLDTSLALTSSRLAELRANSSASEKDRLVLLARITDREDAIASLQSRLDQSQGAFANIRTEYDKTQQSFSSNQAAFVEAQVKLHDLSDQLAEKSNALAREREMLNAGRDVRDLLSARNLHIVDVFDTDPKGKTRPAFGRIFFTEGRSLLFYAYDMPDARLKEATFQYRIWGKKEGPNQRARNLGIFFSDDKFQKRWVFQYDDPKVLSEIDSVFVTLEPSNGDPNQPKGDKLMYAYLRGQPNHP
jgi:hypothetical protein